MSFVEIFLIAVALAMDAFTVAMAVGLHLSCEGCVRPRQYFRLSFHFGLFQFLLPIIGWLAGTTVSEYIQVFDHWLAFLLLTYIGAKLIRDGGRGEEYHRADPTKGASLVLLSVATSIDALAMGLSLAFLGTAIIYPAVIIGIVAGVATCIGLKLGNKIGSHWRSRIAWLGGLILIGIGLKILIEHLRQ